MPIHLFKRNPKPDPNDIQKWIVALDHAIRTGETDSEVILNHFEAALVRNKKILAKNPALYAAAKKTYRKGVIKFEHDVTDVSQQVFLELDDITNTRVDERSPASHQRIADYVNNLSRLVVKQVLSSKLIDLRALIFARWIAVMRRLFNKGDYQSAYAISLGLIHGSVNRLGATHEGVTAIAMNIKSQIEELQEKRLILFEYRGNKSIIPTFENYKNRFTRHNDEMAKLSDEKNAASSAGNIKLAAALDKQMEQTQTLTDKLRDEILVLQEEQRNKRNKKRLRNEKAAGVKEVTKVEKIAEDRYIFLTRNSMGSNTAFEQQSYRVSSYLEPRNAVIKPSTIHRTLPDLLLTPNKKLRISQEARVMIELRETDKRLTNINAQITDILNELKNNSSDLAALITQIEQYQTTDNKILNQSILNKLINDVATIITRKSVNIFVAVILDVDRSFNETLKELKKLLEQTKELQNEKRLLESKRDDILDRNQDRRIAHSPSSVSTVSSSDSEMSIANEIDEDDVDEEDTYYGLSRKYVTTTNLLNELKQISLQQQPLNLDNEQDEKQDFLYPPSSMSTAVNSNKEIQKRTRIPSVYNPFIFSKNAPSRLTEVTNAECNVGRKVSLSSRTS